MSDSLIHFPVDQFIHARLIARTDPKRAYQMMTQTKTTGDLVSVARELEIGRLGEKLGDTPRAVDAYAYVASAWQNTDNEQLKNAVKESRDALKRLDSDGRVRAQLGESAVVVALPCLAARRVLAADLRGSSWPVVVETDDGPRFTKLRGAGQGVLAARRRDHRRIARRGDRIARAATMLVAIEAGIESVNKRDELRDLLDAALG